MKKVALYIRTSTELQTNGMDSQKRALIEYCKSRGLDDYIVFEDFGVSGAKSSRPALDCMISKCKSGEISKVIVYSFSRFGRSLKHLILSLEDFEKWNVSFISVTESVDLGTAFGRTIFNIICSIAQLERELVSERVKNGMKAAKVRGSKIGAKKKFENSQLFLQLSKNGLSTREIAKILSCGQSTVVRALKRHEPQGPLSA